MIGQPPCPLPLLYHLCLSEPYDRDTSISQVFSILILIILRPCIFALLPYHIHATPPLTNQSTCFGRQHRCWTVAELALLKGQSQKMLDNIVGPPLRYDGEQRTRALIWCEDVAKMPFENPIDITRLLRAFLTITSPAADTVQGEDMSNEDSIGTMVFTTGSRMGRQLDVRMWEVIQKEIMDCHEPSQLHRLRGYSNHLPSSENSSQVATFDGTNGRERFQAFITMIAVQLLATCFTLPPESEGYSRPSASYRERCCPIGLPSHPRLISSLRLHTYFRNSPALGHHARDCSPSLAWPDCRSSPSREERHAEGFLRQRRLQALEKPQLRTNAASRRAWSTDSSSEMERNSERVMSTSVRRRNRSSTETIMSHRAPSQRRKVDSIYGRPRRFDNPPTGPLSQNSELQGARPIWRNSRVNAVGSHRWAHGTTYTHRYSFQPVLRSEDHPVFIQPVKEHIIRRWSALRTSPKSTTSGARSDKNLARARRRRNRKSETSSTESSVGTRGPSTESSISNAGHIRLSTPSLEPVELDLTAGDESVEPILFLPVTGPSTAHSSVLNPNPDSLSLPANDSTRTLVNDSASSHLTRNQTTTFLTPSNAEQAHGRMAQRSSSTGTTLFSMPIVARASPDADIMPTKDIGSSSSASPDM